MPNAKPSFFWHDYETFGRDAQRDRPAQFAGLRTDASLNPLGEPLVAYCRPPADYLPDPVACLLTGITPQHCHQHGLSEADFAEKIHQAFSQPGTCGVGYNTLRFDDEFTRTLLYRNFYDPYAREWQQGNSRWDLIDLVRACRALRPEGIVWPHHPDGRPCNTLEALSQANGLTHEHAHDALSDVYATLALAKLLRDKQPRLFEYGLSLRQKAIVSERLNWQLGQPVVHVSGMIHGDYLNTALMMPLAAHPSNRNAVICWDLRHSPEPLLELDALELSERLYTPQAELSADQPRVALKLIHLNKCPFIAPLSTLNTAAAERCQINLNEQLGHQKILANFAENWQKKVHTVFSSPYDNGPRDPELMLYSGPFFSSYDKQLMAQLRTLSPSELSQTPLAFEDNRLEEMLFRYRARNYPDTLTADEQARWIEHCQAKLRESTDPETRNLDQFQAQLEQLAEAHQENDDKLMLLGELSDWGEQLDYALSAADDAR